MSSTLLLPPRAQLCNRSCSNKTHTRGLLFELSDTAHTQMMMAQQQPKVLIFPRRKTLDKESANLKLGSTTLWGSKQREPTAISMCTLSPLFQLPQAEAAQRLGVALTSLKVACRKLGVRRWPYARVMKARDKRASAVRETTALAQQQEREIREATRISPVRSSPNPPPYVPPNVRPVCRATTTCTGPALSREHSDFCGLRFYAEDEAKECYPNICPSPAVLCLFDTTAMPFSGLAAGACVSPDMEYDLSCVSAEIPADIQDDLQWLLCNSDPLANMREIS